MDVSGSMRATDVENPSRIMAAETAAKAYIKDQPRDVRIGIVAFCRHRAAGAGAHHRPSCPDRRHRPLRAAARHRGGQRHPGVAGDDLPGKPGSTCRRSPARGRCRPGRTTSRTPDFTPVAPRLVSVGGDHPAHRRPAHDRPRFARGGEDGGRPRRSASTPSASAPRKARRSASRAGRCASGSTRRRSRRSPS